jgi:segregation and condensation protein A
MESASPEQLKINIDNYSGPLEVLLDLAKLQKVDLAKISITQLADEFIEFINSTKKINLDLASEYLLMATWLAYLKSRLLLPEDEDDDFRASEVAEKLKLQLKKLELIRLLSDQLLKKKRLGTDVCMRGMSGGIRTIANSKFVVSLYELLKSYSNHVMKKVFYQ